MNILNQNTGADSWHRSQEPQIKLFGDFWTFPPMSHKPLTALHPHPPHVLYLVPVFDSVLFYLIIVLVVILPPITQSYSLFPLQIQYLLTLTQGYEKNQHS